MNKVEGKTEGGGKGRKGERDSACVCMRENILGHWTGV